MSDIILLDGGMGQELLRRSKRPPTPMWSADIMLNEPELVRDLHIEFIDSGAQVITLNTYTATPPRLKREHQFEKLEHLHQSAMLAAKQACLARPQHDIKIAGCLPPLVASYKADAALDYERSLDIYRRLVDLQNEHSDLFICETMSSISEAMAACTAAKASKKPVWLALTVNDDDSQTLRSGESLKAALEILVSLSPDAILLNCSQPEAISSCWPLLQQTGLPIGAYANGFTSVEALYPGDTVEQLCARHDLSPSQYLHHARQWVSLGATIIGGCCEIGPAHIKALHADIQQS